MRVVNVGESKFDVAVGEYDPCPLIAIEDENHAEYGAGNKFVFRVDKDGPAKGKLASRTTGTSATAKSALGRMIVQLSGKPLPAAGPIDLDQFIGRPYKIIVETNSTGNGTRVGMVLPSTANTYPSNGTTAAAAPPPPPPPPPPPIVPQEAKYWASINGGSPQLYSRFQLVDLFTKETKEFFGTVQLKPENDSNAAWSSPDKFGFVPEGF